MVYTAYLEKDYELWIDGINGLEAAFQQSGEQDAKCLYELILAKYGLIGYHLSIEEKEVAFDMLDEAQNLAKKLLKMPAYEAQGHALLGALLGLEIGIKPYKAIYLGPKSKSHIEKATETGQGSPSAWVELGNMRYHAPGLFGGSKPEAIEAYKKAIELFDQNPTQRQHNWLYLHALAWLGKTLAETDQPEKALAIYRKALAYEPNFSWIRDELLPEVEGKL